MPSQASGTQNQPLPAVWLCGGGTGGHVYPALAAAAALTGASRPSFVGSSDGMEAGLVQRESRLPFLHVPAAALRGRGPGSMARNAFTLLRGVRATQALIARERPAAILGTGGYVCVPIFIAARLARIPTVIYLPDVVPGLAVRLLARIASAVACSVEDSARYLAKRADGSMIMTGYPVRAELHNLDRAACRAAFGLRDNLPTLLIYGGSRGARSINQATAALLASILPIAQIIHVCGREGDHTFLEAAAAQLPAELRSRYLLYQYLHSSDQEAAVVPSMISAFGAADLTLCRSGASTIGELPAVGLPAVLVPYPYVHQEENADYLVRHGAAQKVLDGEMLGDGRPDDGPLFRQLRHLIVESSERDNMAQRSRALARPEAAHQLAGILLALAAGRRVA